MNEDMEVSDIVHRSGKKFFLVLSIVCVFGVIMVLSSSYMYAKEAYDNSLYFFFRQLSHLALGCGMAFFIYKTKYTFWIKYGYPIHFLATLIMALTLVPEIGIAAKGASRWISLFGLSFQPSEGVKYTAALASIHYFDYFDQMDVKKRIQRAIYLLLPLGILLVQPDFGSFSIVVMVMAFTCFLSSFPRKIFYSSIPIGIGVMVAVLLSSPYRVRRLFAFLNPWENPRGSGFQIIQSLYGFANGSWLGQGLGNSNEKLFYLPEAHNDFIFSVIGEELGFLGVFILAFLFIALVYFGFRAAAHIKDRQGSLLSALIVFLIGLQAFLNMGVVLGLLPTKGLNLPFISYGGSSLVGNFFGIGLFFSVLKAHVHDQTTSRNERTFANSNSSSTTQNMFENPPSMSPQRTSNELYCQLSDE